MIRGNGSEPEDQSREREHREGVHGPLLKAGGDSAVLFQAAHQPLDSIPLTIKRRIEAMPAVQGALIAPARDNSPFRCSGELPA